MTADGFLTVLSIFMAGYAILGLASRLRIRLHLYYLLSSSVLFFIMISYFVFFDVFSLHCWLPNTKICQFLNISHNSKIPGMLAFILTLLWMISSIIILYLNKLSPHAIPTLSKLVSELSYQNKYNEIIEVVSPHLTAIQDKEHDYPVHCTNIYNIILTDNNFGIFISKFRTDFAVNIASLNHFGVQNYIEKLLEYQISNSDSPLYKELANNQNFKKGHYYNFPLENLLLNKLVKDSEFAFKYATYRPIGEYIISKLNPLINKSYIETINYPCDSFYNKEKFQDPVFMGIFYFDLIVTTAVENKTKWHMWLYYYTHFLKAIITIHDENSPHINISHEYPTRGSYLIYEIFANLTNWIKLIKDIDDKISPHYKIKTIDNSHQNDNIPKSSCIAIGACLEYVLTSTNINEEFKKYIYCIVIGCISELSNDNEEGKLRKVLILCITHKGYYKPDDEYIKLLKYYFNYIDHTLKQQVSDFKLKLFTL